MATTVLQALNRVLVKLGEEQVPVSTPELTENYQLLVASFLNDIKEEIEDAHNWRALRQTVTTSILADARSGVITEANERSRVVRIAQQNRQGLVPLVFDVTDTQPCPLVEIDLAELLYRDTLEPDTRQDPAFFAVDNSSADVLEILVWPRPSGTRSIQSTLIIPQDRYAPTDVSVNVAIPIRPLVVGATWYALEERGEELGANGLFNEARYRDALDSAIARDDAEQGNVHELISV